MNRLAPLLSSAKSDWQTPYNVLELVRKLGPIGLDPCSTRENPTEAWRCFYPPEFDGLSMLWSCREEGELIYVNPPYGRGIGDWMRRCKEAAEIGEEVIALVPARPDTRWFQRYCAPPHADAVCFWRGRLTFKGAPNPAPFPSAIVWWSGHGRTSEFQEVFFNHGAIWT